MKWITRERVKVDRVACPWLIKKFVDPEAEFLFVPADQVLAVAEREGATPYDVKGVELGHHGKECSFEAILKRYHLTGDPALMLLGKIVNGADTDNTLWNQPEGPGLEAIAEGFRHLGFKDDHEVNAAEWIVYDALYAYCQEMVRQGITSLPALGIFVLALAGVYLWKAKAAVAGIVLSVGLLGLLLF